jgi:uncharacterized protein with PIN domain
MMSADCPRNRYCPLLFVGNDFAQTDVPSAPGL